MFFQNQPNYILETGLLRSFFCNYAHIKPIKLHINVYSLHFFHVFNEVQSVHSCGFKSMIKLTRFRYLVNIFYGECFFLRYYRLRTSWICIFYITIIARAMSWKWKLRYRNVQLQKNACIRLQNLRCQTFCLSLWLTFPTTKFRCQIKHIYNRDS